MSENNVKSYYKEFYKTQVVANLKKENNFKNIMSIPKVEKITLNMGIGIRDSKILEMALKDMEEIAGQKPVVTKSRKSIANFKLREGMKLGVKVTLRGDNMYNFLQRLICVAMPQIQDFMGVREKSFDGRGNYSLGIKDILAFGIEFKNNDSYHTGLDISITTSAVNDEGALLLLRELGFPFKQKRNKI
jgi:large subunit ribosomal protein L5